MKNYRKLLLWKVIYYLNFEAQDTFYVSNLKQKWLVRMKCKSLLTDKVSNNEDINSELDRKAYKAKDFNI